MMTKAEKKLIKNYIKHMRKLRKTLTEFNKIDNEIIKLVSDPNWTFSKRLQFDGLATMDSRLLIGELMEMKVSIWKNGDYKVVQISDLIDCYVKNKSKRRGK